MNKDYTYCVGFGIDAIPVKLCKKCRRLVPFGKPAPKDDIWWTRKQANVLYTNQKQNNKLWQNLTK